MGGEVRQSLGLLALAGTVTAGFAALGLLAIRMLG